MNEALGRAFVRGRDGRGCPLIFAAGNSGHEPIAYPANLWQCFAVGASTFEDSRYEYSNFGTTLDVVAPSGRPSTQVHLLTLDQMGDLGANTPSSPMEECWEFNQEYDYVCDFWGTSASAAIVSGIASLLLARDSQLTAPELYLILRHSAETELTLNGLPIVISPPHLAFGYGRADAFRALLAISRGDLSHDGNVTLVDLSMLLDILFGSMQPAYPHPLLADCDCDGQIGLGDLTRMIDHLFISLGPLETPCYNFGS
jgi:subtilisin family serine protease